MIRRKGLSKIFFGWWTVLAGGVLSFWGWGFGNFGFSVLFKPISSELGLSRAATSLAASIGKFEGGPVSPIVGWATDRFGPKWMVVTGVFLMCLGLILMNYVNSLLSFILVWGVLVGTGANIGLQIPVEKAITNWFVKKRGLALSIRFAFIALSAMLMVPIVAWFLSMQGWRMTFVIAGLVLLIAGLPLGWFCVKQNRPEYYGLLPDGVSTEDKTADIIQMIDKGTKYAAEVAEIEFTLRQAIKTPAYWLLVLAFAGFSLIPPVLILHGMPFLTDMGVDAGKAATIIGLMGSGVIPGALIGMFAIDRIKKEHLRFLAAAAFFIHIAGFVAFLLNQTLAMVYPLFFLHHLSAGVFAPLMSMIPARYFGRKAYASIRGTILVFMLPVSMVAPIYIGWVYDTTGSYTTIFLISAVVLMICTLILIMAFPPKPPAQPTNIQEIV